MGLRINTNTDALDAYRNLSITQNNMSSSLQKLSSGYQINKAADNASGLSISEGLQAQIGGLSQAVSNAQDGINVVQTADGALTEVDSILQRMNDLAVQASNTGSQGTTARQAAQTEVTQLNADLDNIGNTTQYGNSNLLDGTFGNSAAQLAGGATIPAGGVVTTATHNTFAISGTFEQASGATAASGALTVTVGLGTYSTAATYQTALQQGIDAAFTTAGYSAGTVTATVTDSGNNVWKVNLASNKAETSTGAGTVASPYVYTGSTFATSAVGTSLTGITAGTSSTATTAGGVFQIGSNNATADQLNVSINAVNSQSLGTSGIDLVNNASSAITTIANAINTVSTERSQLGAYQNGFQHTINNLNVTVENLQSSNASIMDTDMAAQMVQFTQQQVLMQAGVSMLSQANSESQSVLKLLQ